MGPRDKIAKSALNLLNSSKDLTAANIAAASATGRIKIDKHVMPVLIDLINQSIDAGYHRAYKSFMKLVDEAIVESNAEQTASVAKRQSTKKN